MRAGFEVIKRRIETLIEGNAGFDLADWPVEPITLSADRGIAVTAEFREWTDYGNGEAGIAVRVLVQDGRGEASAENYHAVEAVAELIRESAGSGRITFAASPDAMVYPDPPAAFQWTLLSMIGGLEALDADRDTGFAIELNFDAVIQRP